MKLAILLGIVVPLLAQQPRISNARLETRQAAGSLDATFQAILKAQTSPAWVAYAEPMVAGDRQNECWAGGGGYWRGHSGDGIAVTGAHTVKLEGPTHIVVLFRVENHQIGKIEISNPECDLDAGGLPFIWLTGVSAPESIRFLESIVKSEPGSTGDGRRINDAAVAAIALHADPAADAVLDQLAAQNQPENTRHQAIFWLGSARGSRGINRLIAMAHNDPSPRIRGDALFWLAQKAGQKAAESSIQDAIANDPQTEVKRRAVFALTQMPNGQGIPLLIEIARNNRNAEVRKQAVFWLGQSKDPRALTFIESVLK